jgi:hypothetical protein
MLLVTFKQETMATKDKSYGAMEEFDQYVIFEELKKQTQVRKEASLKIVDTPAKKILKKAKLLLQILTNTASSASLDSSKTVEKTQETLVSLKKQLVY